MTVFIKLLSQKPLFSPVEWEQIYIGILYDAHSQCRCFIVTFYHTLNPKQAKLSTAEAFVPRIVPVLTSLPSLPFRPWPWDNNLFIQFHRFTNSSARQLLCASKWFPPITCHALILLVSLPSLLISSACLGLAIAFVQLQIYN